jgi:hypothetical protein
VSDSDQEKQPATVEEAAREALSWLDEEERAYVAARARDDLIDSHFFARAHDPEPARALGRQRGIARGLRAGTLWQGQPVLHRCG